jgi:hypothetical protein
VNLLSLLGDWARGITPARARAGASWAWTNRTPLLAVAVVLFAALYFRACGRASTAEGQAAAAAARGSDEVKAEAAGIPVVREVTPADVKAQLERLLAQNAKLRDQHARDEKVMGDLRAELVARIRTEPVLAAVPVAKGDPLRLDADLVVNRTKAGAHLLEGTLSAWSGEDLVVMQPFSQPTTMAVMAAPETPAAEGRRWHLGPAGGVAGGPGGGGWLVGGTFAYQLKAWTWRPLVTVTAAAGPGGGVGLVGAPF